MLSHPAYSPDLVLADFFYFLIKPCNERDEIQGCLISATDCDERTEGDTGRSVFLGIQFIV
jgi:hypothetical protein